MHAGACVAYMMYAGSHTYAADSARASMGYPYFMHNYVQITAYLIINVLLLFF